MAFPTAEQYSVLTERVVVHEPTATTITFPQPQLWSDSGFSLCWTAPADGAPDGPTYDRFDVIDMARHVMRERSLESAA
jgi:hypothetical protein